MTMLYLSMHKALISFENGSSEFTLCEEEDYSLYVTREITLISSQLYLGKFKIDLGCIGKMTQCYITISDNLINDLNSIGYNLSCLQLSIQN